MHDRRRQNKQDRRLRDKVVFLTLIKRRFRCLWCSKVFTEPDEVFGSRKRSSYRFREYLRKEALHQAVRRTAQKEQVGEGLVRRCVTEERLRSLEDTISNDYLPEFKELLHTLGNWREEIPNYFDYPIANGFVKGKNNRIKTIKRMAYPSPKGPEHG